MRISKARKEIIMNSPKDLESFGVKIKSTQNIWVILTVLAAIFIFSLMIKTFDIEWINKLSTIIFLVIALIFMVILRRLITYKKREYKLLEHWFSGNDFKYNIAGKFDSVKSRFDCNPTKRFFYARDYTYATKIPIGPYAEAKKNGKTIWIYRVKVYSILREQNEWFRNPEEKKSRFSAWCVEISTHKIPVWTLITKQHLQESDSVNTGSSRFENLYHVSTDNKKNVLQLLDPNMITLITYSRVAAMEFSDSSIVLYNADEPPVIEALDLLLEAGLKIAEQVDRNFPMGKYN